MDITNKKLTNPEELKGVLLELECANCSESTYAVPYLPGATHKLRCTKCAAYTIVSIEDKGGIQLSVSSS